LALGLLCALWAWPALAQQEEPLAIYYFHRPPFYSHHGQGIVLERACQALRAAGVPFTLVELPVKRVLRQIKWGHYACGVGWYKLASRQDYANFSLPLHHSAPPALLVNRLRAGALPARPTLEQVLKSPLIRGQVDGYAFGDRLDAQLARLRPPTVTTSGTSENMLRMLAGGRCDYWLINPEEARWLLEHHPRLAPSLEIRPLADAPPGQPRHLMCSQKVPPEVMQRIDRAIAALDANPQEPCSQAGP
jgi:polar amino acid transport system substrate-binding protein